MKHRELSVKELSPNKKIELDAAKSKEWGKIIKSGAMVVHVGESARKLEREVGIWVRVSLSCHA